MDQTILFLLLMITGTFLLGLNDVQKKKALNQGVNEEVLLGVHLFLGGMLLMPFLFIFGIPEIKDTFLPAFLGTVLLNIVGQYFFIRAFKMDEASLVAPLRLIIPPLVIFTAYLFLNETPSFTGVLGIFITMTGLWFLLFSDNLFSLTQMKIVGRDRGVLFGLLGSVLFALSFPLDKQAVVSSSALFTTSVTASTVGALSLVISFFLRRSFLRDLKQAFQYRFGSLFFISLVFGGGVFLTNQALNYSLAAYAASLKRLQVLWTVFLSRQLLNEKGIGKKLVAAIIMFTGVLITVMWK